ncbi:scavenger receptor cysteine-rich domain-containing group B protein isoform X2 [Xenopus tropicalis]|uniref:Scavenger receptor cysteine-rich domain-containing group B protein isoform X2 n=1 Tax=Xenopus tropicalis TaxID=8364 RepID=A0A8J1JTL8_XENTR|nr:scavenger receptor cysteine-rich domain-containing group B protein isoform X2 [Xenopus tropicalis]
MAFLLPVVFVMFHGLSSAGILNVRLSDGPDRCTGRVEIFVHNEWGTICDDDWDMADAAVVCRELSCGTAIRAPPAAAFGFGKGKIWLDNVKCRGDESLLHQCNHKKIGAHDCDHKEDASVVCSGSKTLLDLFEDSERVSTESLEPTPMSSPAPTEPIVSLKQMSARAADHIEPGSIRLVNGGGRCAGRVEIYYNGTWGTVCDDLWNMSSARVVCRQLHCGEPISANIKAFFGVGKGVIWLDNVRCIGSENTLRDCNSHWWGKHDCVHDEDAGVVCSDHLSGVASMYNEDTAKTTKTSKPVQPTSGTPDTSHHLSPESPQYSPVDHLSGAASIYNEDTEKTTKTSKPVQPVSGSPDKSHHLSPESPQHSPVATEPGSIRLVNGGGRCEGRVEIYYNGTWGTVCDDLWNMNNARVVCRQLHCGEPKDAKIKAFFGSGKERIWMDNVECDGSENALNDCNFPGWGLHDCSHNEDAAVVCSDQAASVYNEDTAKTTSKPVLPASGTPDKSHHLSPESPQHSPVATEPGSIRLVNGGGRCEGRVEIYYNGTWGTVCDDLWNMSSARVVCRQLHCGEPKDAKKDAFFGSGEESIWMDNVECDGSENALNDCNFRGWGLHDCSHNEDAGVVCSDQAAFVYNEDTAKTTKTSKPVLPTSRTPDKSHHLSPESSQHSPVDHLSGAASIYNEDTAKTTKTSKPVQPTLGTPDKSHHLSPESPQHSPVDHLSGAASIYNEETAKTTKTSKPVQPTSGTPDKSHHLSPESPQHSPVGKTLTGLDPAQPTRQTQTHDLPDEGKLDPECTKKIKILSCESRQYPELIEVLKDMRNDFRAFSAAFQEQKGELKSIAQNLHQLSSSLQEILAQNIALQKSTA